MTVAELRIGNLLTADIGTVKVESVLGSSHRVYAHSLDEEYLADYAIKHLQPTPLTEEWLLKAGFVDTNGIFAKYPLYGMFTFHSEECIDLHIYVGGFGSSIKNGCQYVHQLQNLYFALTGEELDIANN